MTETRYRMSAAPLGTVLWRGVGRNRKTGRFLFLGTPHARILSRRGLLTLTIPKSEIDKFHDWCDRKGLRSRSWKYRTQADHLVELAIREVGTTEQPLGSNRGPRVDYYRRATTLFVSLQKGWPWCCAFVVRMALDAGYDLPQGARTASVWAFTEWARKTGRIVSRDPQPGDAVVLLKEGQHIGIVERYDAELKICHTIEGNTTPDGMYGSQYEGTAVAPKERHRFEVIHVIDLQGL